jgi:uncharacterized membrane protein YcaP (DUF421 family)
MDLVLTAARASILYFFMLLVIRLLGKREIGNFTAFDLIVALMLGEVVDEVIFGDVALAKGLLVIAVVAIWHAVNSYSSYRSTAIHRATGGVPTELVTNGQILHDALAKERLHEEELWSQLRELQIDDLAEVKTATLETNGRVSVIKADWARPVQKQDLAEERGKQS